MCQKNSFYTILNFFEWYTRVKQYFAPSPELEKKLNKNGKLELLESLIKIQNKVQLRFIPQSDKLPYGSGSPVLAAKSFIGSSPFVLVYGDDMIIENQPGRFLKTMIGSFHNHHTAGVIAAQEVGRKEATRYGCLKFYSDKKSADQISEIVEKPSLGQLPSTLVIDGRFVFSAEILGILEKTLVRNNELMLTDAINTLARSQKVLAAPITDGHWTTTGDPLRWLKTNLLMASKGDKIKKNLKKLFSELKK